MKNKSKVVTEDNKSKVKIKDPKKKLSYSLKKWFFGVGKEFGRITWPSKSRIIRDFFTAIIIVALLCLIFLGFDQISGLIK